MDLDAGLAVAGAVLGFVVGLTGMGGGALMTPVLVLLFGVPPLTAVSSDLVVSLFVKPVGGAVHLRRGTVHRTVVAWLVVGSVPSAFCGVLVLQAVGDGERVQDAVTLALGVALLLASAAIVVKAALQLRALAERDRLRRAGIDGPPRAPVVVRPVPTLLVGGLGGFVVGMTSVGSGSLIIVMLLLLYPTMRSSEVVGTDLVQAVPLVGAAALGHLLFGAVELDLTASLLLGALPAVHLGARASSRAPQGLVRAALVVVLLASGLTLLGLGPVALGAVLLVALTAGPALWVVARRRLLAYARSGTSSGRSSQRAQARGSVVGRASR